MEESKILPCPFCGNKHPKIVVDFDSNGDNFYIIECSEGCGASGPGSDCYLKYTGILDDAKERESAIKKWNLRYKPPMVRS